VSAPARTGPESGTARLCGTFDERTSHAGNGQIIAVGEAYESMAACLNGIESIRTNAPSATVVDMTAASAPKPAGAKPMAHAMAKSKVGAH